MIISMSIHVVTGNSLVVQWLALYAFAAVGLGLIPGGGTNIAQAMQYASLHPKRKIKNTNTLNQKADRGFAIQQHGQET